MSARQPASLESNDSRWKRVQLTCQCGERYWVAACRSLMARKCASCRRNAKNERRRGSRQPDRASHERQTPDPSAKGYRIMHDPGPYPLSAGLPLADDEVEHMLHLGCFYPGTVIRFYNGRSYTIKGETGTEQAKVLVPA